MGHVFHQEMSVSVLTVNQLVEEIFASAKRFETSVLIIIRSVDGINLFHYSNSEKGSVLYIQNLLMNNSKSLACLSNIKVSSGLNITTRGKCIQSTKVAYQTPCGVFYNIGVTFTPAKVVGHEFITVTFLD